MTPFLLLPLVAMLCALSVPVLVVVGSKIGLWNPVAIDWSFVFSRHRRPLLVTTQGVATYSPLAPAMAIAASLTITAPPAIIAFAHGGHSAGTGSSVTAEAV